MENIYTTPKYENAQIEKRKQGKNQMNNDKMLLK